MNTAEKGSKLYALIKSILSINISNNHRTILKLLRTVCYKSLNKRD